MRALRSLLFVPGHKHDWIAKALASDADGVIIDLEDSVPEKDKALARTNARDAILAYEGDKAMLVRPNGLGTSFFADDLLAVTVEGLDAFLLPMLTSRDDVVAFGSVISAGEIANGLVRNTVEVVPSFETAASIEHAAEILSGPRVGGAMAAAAKDADVSRSVGFRWTAEGDETLYLRSRILMAARSVDLQMIVLGLWQDVHDLDGMRTFAAANFGLGYTGQVLIHPSHAMIANEVYGMDDASADYYRRLIAAFEAGLADGSGAVTFQGEHIDLAHANNARELLMRAGR